MPRGKRVVLRDKKIGDAVRDYAWGVDEELARLDAVPPLSIPFDEYLKGYAEELRHQSSRRRRLAIDTLLGEHIGNCTYYDVESSREEAEIGIMIGDRRFWGGGYGHDAVTALVHHLFEEVGVKRVRLRTLEWNTRAQKCFRRSGFVPCGRATEDGKSFVLMEVHRVLGQRKRQ